MPLRTFYIIIKSDYVDIKGYLNLFPWMKIHGSIEANLMSYRRSSIHSVSMNENSWLYWSPVQTCPQVLSQPSGFHEWKFMALLKPDPLPPDFWIHAICFHEWKFMALLKLREYLLSGNGILDVSMNENSWLYWSQIPLAPGTNYTTVFPWMKIHGSIEAGECHCG